MTTLNLLEVFLGFLCACVALWTYSLSRSTDPQN